jgi:hypothetical protein
MKHTSIFQISAGLVLVAAGFGLTAKTTAPTLASEVDREISGIEKKILDIAEAMPEEKYNFSPETLNIPGAAYQGVRTFARELKHIAASNYIMWPA